MNQIQYKVIPNGLFNKPVSTNTNSSSLPELVEEINYLQMLDQISEQDV